MRRPQTPVNRLPTLTEAAGVYLAIIQQSGDKVLTARARQQVAEMKARDNQKAN